MPIHDWSKVEAGIFHDFHQSWTIELRNALNRGILPTGYFAMADQIVSGPIPDVVMLQKRDTADRSLSDRGGIAIADAPPQARYTSSAEVDRYATRANRIAIRHRLGEVIAFIEIISPGNKSSLNAVRTFATKAYNLLNDGVNLLVVDLFPPSARDPEGIHPAIWEQFIDEPFELPTDKPLTVAAYMGGEVKRAYVEPVAVGDALPAMPIFLDNRTYVSAPLESAYQSAWETCPEPVREIVENPGVEHTSN